MVLASALLAASACTGQGLDKAGGERAVDPVVLTLADHEESRGHVQQWIDEVERRSAGELRIEVSNRWREKEPDYDKGTIEDVRSGKVQLAKIAARAYDTVGVRSFQPLLAPFLIDNHALEQQVLESELAGRMLSGTDRLNLVGLALLPTDLRKPLGLSRPLVTAADYRGARIGVREGRLAEATFKALGAATEQYPAGDPLRGLDGAELGLETISTNGYDAQARAVTANVNLWPKVITIVMNRAAYDSLNPRQRQALRQAGAAVVAHQSALMRDLAEEAVDALCARGLPLVHADQRQLAALRAAVQPVYDELRRDAGTQALLRSIEAMKAGTRQGPDAPSCAPPRGAPQDEDEQDRAIDGRYRTGFSRAELAHSPLLYDGGEINDRNWGEFTLTLDGGRAVYEQRNAVERSSSSGTYSVDGDVLTLRFADSTIPYVCRWSLYRDVLVLERDPAVGIAPTWLLVKAWRRPG